MFGFVCVGVWFVDGVTVFFKHFFDGGDEFVGDEFV